MSGISRRHVLRQAGAFSVANATIGIGSLLSAPLAFASAARADELRLPPPSDAEAAAMADLANKLMAQYDVPALSVAVGWGGAILYERAFGWADREEQVAATPAHLFRIASVTKTITSATIFTLIEAGKLRLGDTVFGPGAVLGTDFGAPPYNPGVDQITIEHLLTHTCGGWNNTSHDPMFSNPQMDHRELIEWTLRTRPLDNPPGHAYAYSNFGFCVLGRVIERLTGQRYDTHVRDNILARCGVSDMVIGGNTLAQRRPDEVRYYVQGGGDAYGMNVTRMDSHGGWLARPSDLVQFVMHVDGFPQPPNILRPDTIKTMVTGSTANAHYAKGWQVNAADNWWHGGNLPGTTTLAVRTRSGFCWAAFTNTRVGQMGADLDRLLWHMVSQVKAWPLG